MLENIFSQQGTKTFLQVGHRSYSYLWLQDKIRKLIALFETLELRSGDRLLLAVSDDVEMSALFLAALARGITTVIADPEMKAPRAASIIQRSGPKVIIADKASLDSWALGNISGCMVVPLSQEVPARPGLLSRFLQKSTVPAATTDYHSRLERVSAVSVLPSAPEADQIAYIIFTSGTTAASKGVAVSYGNMTAHLATLMRVYALMPGSQLFNQLLLCHADGCIQGPVLAAAAGCTLHRPFRFSIDKIPAVLDYCFANNITHLFMVPAMLNMLVQFADTYEDNFSYPAFRALISVSAHLDAHLWDQFEAIFKVPVTNVYGLTETVAGSLFCGPDPHLRQKYTVGKPVDCRVRIVDGSGADVQTGETGELLLKGPHIMRSYWRDPHATDDAFRDGWFCTGDLASADAEGFVTIRGRRKNLIISGGINIQPEEVTECLLGHREVAEACALGLPDPVFGERLVAAVVLRPGAQTTAYELVEHCRQLLEEKKVPQKIFLVTTLPKGVSGKVQLEILKDQIAALQAPSEHTSAYADDIINIAAEAFQVPSARLSLKDNSNTVSGWDSLAHLVFVTALEERFHTRFSTAEVITMNSIQKAVELVKQKNGRAAG